MKLNLAVEFGSPEQFRVSSAVVLPYCYSLSWLDKQATTMALFFISSTKVPDLGLVEGRYLSK